MAKTACIIRHVGWQDAGVLKPALEANGYKVEYLDALLVSTIDQQVDQAEIVIVLGGPNGAYDEAVYPRLADELRLIERRLQADRPLLGICLGAQLIARVLGAEVKSMQAPEIGFGSLISTTFGSDSLMQRRAAAAPVLYWHEDTFDIPHGAVHLARSDRCVNQAFSYGKSALALQFHLEPDPMRFEEWLVGNAYQLVRVGIDPRVLRADMANVAGAFAGAGGSFVSAWLDCLEQGLDFVSLTRTR